MAIVAAGIVIGYDWTADKRFNVRLDIYSYTSENSASGVLTSETYDVDDAEGFVNAGIHTFLRTYILEQWGVTLSDADTIEIINPYIKASAVAALNSKFSAFWKLDEDTDSALPLSDSQGGFDLTNNNGVTFLAGTVGGGANFYPAASMKSLTRAYDAALNPTDGLTFSCRVKFSSPGGIQGIAGTWTATSKGWALVMDAGFGGAFRVYIAADGLDTGDNYGIAYNGGWNDNLWHRVVVRIDGAGATNDDRLTITVDDVLQPLTFEAGTIPAAIMDDGGAFTIGDWNGNYADGMIDECELRDLSGALIAQWKFDGAPRVDSIGANDLAEIGTVTREAVAGGGWAATFSGSGYLAIADSADLASGDFDFAIAIVVKPTSAAVYCPILSSWYIDPTGAASRAVYELWWNPADGGTLHMLVHDGTTLNDYFLDLAALSVPIDRWSLVVVQYDAATDTISVRVNEQAAESFVLPTPILNDSNWLHIGWEPNGAMFNGAMRRFGYAPHLLSEPEVFTVWNNGQGQNWPMEEAQPEGNTRYCRLGGPDHEVSDTTKTNVPGMSFALEAGFVYSFEFTLFTTSNAEWVGVQLAVLLDEGTETTGRCNYFGPVSASDMEHLTGNAQPFTFDPTASQGDAPGTVKISGTTEVLFGGTLRLTHGSSDASLTTVLRGSWGMCARHNS